MLGSSISSADVDLRAVTRETGEGSGVAHGDVLVRLVNAVVPAPSAGLADVRAAVLASLGVAGLVDAAAVIASFTINNRIVDANGVPLDRPMELATRALRDQIGTDAYATAANTPTGGRWSRMLAWLASMVVPRLLRWMGRRPR